MRRLIVFAVLIPLTAALPRQAGAQAPDKKPSSKEQPEVVARLTWPTTGEQPAFIGSVASIKADGQLELTLGDAFALPAKGRYLATFTQRPSPENLDSRKKDLGMIGAPLEVVAAEKGRPVTCRVAASAAKKLSRDMLAMLIKPGPDSDDALRALPDSFTLTFADEFDDLPEAAKASLHKLNTIGIALHNYADVHSEQVVPSSVIGPDGKPWHSWRVLLLPYLGDGEWSKLYEEYRLDEPWDGPNNKKLFDKMPEVYRHPLDKEGTSETRYLAAVGAGAGLEPAASSFKTARELLAGPIRSRVTLGSVIDGLSNTIFAGECAEDAKVPWTKPEDLKLDKDFPGLNGKDGFAAAYQDDKVSPHKFGAFVFMDAAPRAIAETIKPHDLRQLVVRNDRTPKEVPFLGEPTEEVPNAMELVVTKTKDGMSGRLRAYHDPKAPPAKDFNVDIARIIVDSVEMAIKLYKIQVRELPRTLDDLVNRPAALPRGGKWSGPYMEEIRDDSWGRPLLYTKKGDSFEVRSLGPDGKANTKDDIVAPEPTKEDER
jgi:hypothetical protein